VIDLDDQTRSVNRMLWKLFAPRVALPGGFRIELQRTRKLQRPQMRLERTNHRTVNLGSGLYRDDCQFAITYYGLDRMDVDKVIAEIKQFIDNGGTDYSFIDTIPAWRFGWAFPQPLDLAQDTTVVGTIPAGTYQVRISGVDRCGNESAASPNLPVVLASPGSFFLRVPRVPWNQPLFRQYKCYVNGHLEATITMPQWGYPTFSLTHLVGTGVAPKEMTNLDGSLNAIRWRFLRVTRFASNVQEDLLNNGMWQGTITLETSIHQPRLRTQDQIIGHVDTVVTVTDNVSLQDTSSYAVNV